MRFLPGLFLLLSSMPAWAQTLAIQAQYPAANQTGVARNTAIHLRLTTAGSAPPQIVLRQEGSASTIPLNNLYPGLETQLFEAIVRPYVDLTANTTYQVTATQGSASLQFKFTTGAALDASPPRLLAASPDPASGQADPWGPFRLLFDEPLAPYNGQISVTGGGDVSQEFSPDRRTMTLRVLPQRTIPPIVRLDFTPRDLIGNAPAAPQSITFQTTLGRGMIGPRVLGISPENGATEVPANSAVQLLFDHIVDPNSLSKGLVLESHGQVLAMTPRTVTGNLVVLGGVTLLPSTAYRVKVTAQLLDENGFAVDQPAQYDFTTAAAPSSDLSGQTTYGPGYNTSPPTNARFVVRSVRPMPTFVPLQFATAARPTSGMYTLPTIALSGTLSADRRTLVLTPKDPLPPYSAIGVELTGLTDITGQDLRQTISFTTGGGPDTAAPVLVSSTPSPGAREIPVTIPLRFQFNEPLGLMTAEDAVRLRQNGEPVPGKFTISDSALDFVPAAGLQPGVEYTVELSGVADTAGNVAPSWTATFQTAGDSRPPSGFFRLLRSTLQERDPAPTDALEFQFSRPLRGGHTSGSVAIMIARQFDSPLAYVHPSRIEVDGDTLRLIPLLPWPSRDATVSIFAQDLWGFNFFSSYSMHAGAGDTDRPEVVSIDPPAGTMIDSGQLLRVTFSKPMLDATQLDGGVILSQGSFVVARSGDWSADRRTLTLPFTAVYTSFSYLTASAALTLSSHLTDLAGNPLRTTTAIFPIGKVPVASDAYSSLPTPVKSWPSGNSWDSVLDPRSGIDLLLNKATDADTLNRGVWVFTQQGPTSGKWSVSAGGLLASFTPDAQWPYSSIVRLISYQPSINLTYGWTTHTPAAPASTLSIRSYTLPNFGTAPANSVIEVEFNRDVPAGPLPWNLQSRLDPVTQNVAFDESAPSPRVRRLTPRTPLQPGATIILSLGPNSIGVPSGTITTTKLTAPLTDAGLVLRAHSPLPDAHAVARTARVSLRFSGMVNPLSVNESTVRITAGGRLLPVQLYANQSGFALPGVVTAIPLEPLPANQLIDVRVEGLEDPQGRAVPGAAWSFRTADTVDIVEPRLLYSNFPLAGAGFDPLAAISLTFDEPLDVATLPADLATVDFSPDLRTVSFAMPGGWPRGMSQSFRGTLSDWSGNGSVPNLIGLFGFDADTTGLSILALSPPGGSNNVPINPRFSVLFNKPMAGDALRYMRLTHDADAVPLSDPVSSASGLLTFGTAVPLKPFTDYELTVEGVRDASGNTIGGARTILFRTGEEYDVTSPVPVQRRLRADQPLWLRFAEPLDGASIAAPRNAWLKWRVSGGDNAREPLPVSWNPDTLELTLTPAHALDGATEYTLDLIAITDLAGRSVGSITFTPEIVDPTPVTVTFPVPDGATGVPLNYAPQVRFSRGVTLPPARLVEAGRTAVRFLGGTSGTAITFSYSLADSTAYRVEVDAFTDSGGNSVPAQSSGFTTGTTSDLVAMRLVSSVPANGDAGVDPLQPWALTFNKQLNSIQYFDSSPAAARSVPYTFGWSVSGPILTATASPAWPAATTINWRIARAMRGFSGFTDWLGNPLAQELNFSVRTAAIHDPVAPVLESVTPPSGSTLPGGNSTVTLRFSKPVMTPSDGLQVYVGTNQSGVNRVFGTDPRTVTISLYAAEGARITIMGTEAIRDNSDNPVEPFALEYTAGPPTPSGNPTATLVEPTGYPILATTAVMVRFDRIMQQDSVLQSFRVTQNNENVAGAFDVLENGRAYRFKPSAPFRPGALVRVFIVSSAVDMADRSFTGYPPLATFSIVGPSNQPELLQTFGRSVPVDSILEVEFDRDLDLSSVHGESVWLRRGNRLVGGTPLVRDGRILQFLPDAVLEPGGEYVLTLGAALRSVEGGAFGGHDLRFRTTPVEDAPHVVSTEIAEWLGRPAIHLRFDRAVSPIGASHLSVEQGGRRLPSDVLRSTDGSEFWIVPREDAEASGWMLVLDELRGRNGRALAPRRIPSGRRALQ